MTALLVSDKSLKHTNKRIRQLMAPGDLQIPFWLLRAPLAQVESYDSTSFWLTGMNKAQKRRTRPISGFSVYSIQPRPISS